MSIKDLFKTEEPIMLLEPWEPTKQQKYASIIGSCLKLGVKIPSEFVSEYNKSIDIETPKRGKQTTASEVLYPKRPKEVLYECDPSKAITCRKVTCKYSEHRKDGITPCDVTTHKEWARLDDKGREIIALGEVRSE